MIDPFENVLMHPHSVAARRQLAAHWRACNDPRARLIELQLQKHDGTHADNRWEVLAEIRELIEEHGREWAGQVAELAERYRFELGLVAEIEIKGEVFLEHAGELVRLAPIVHLGIDGPVDVQRLVASPEMAQMSTLTMTGGDWLDDAAAETLAGASTVRRLRVIELCGGRITGRGLDALARSPNLRDVAYIELTGNPCANGEHQTQAYRINERYYIIGERGLPHLEGARRAAIRSYDPMSLIYWPPLPELFAYEE